ncbi:hypothetical protein STEG23_007245, partial [Scotinomys teguina]
TKTIKGSSVSSWQNRQKLGCQRKVPQRLKVGLPTSEVPDSAYPSFVQYGRRESPVPSAVVVMFQFPVGMLRITAANGSGESNTRKRKLRNKTTKLAVEITGVLLERMRGNLNNDRLDYGWDRAGDIPVLQMRKSGIGVKAADSLLQG